MSFFLICLNVSIQFIQGKLNQREKGLFSQQFLYIYKVLTSLFYQAAMYVYSICIYFLHMQYASSIWLFATENVDKCCQLYVI